MKKIFVTLISLFLLIGASTTASASIVGMNNQIHKLIMPFTKSAAGDYTIRITGKGVRVRQYPTTRSRILGQVKQGYYYTACGWDRGDGRGWYLIYWKGGYGWVCSQFAYAV